MSLDATYQDWDILHPKYIYYYFIIRIRLLVLILGLYTKPYKYRKICIRFYHRNNIKIKTHDSKTLENSKHVLKPYYDEVNKLDD